MPMTTLYVALEDALLVARERGGLWTTEHHLEDKTLECLAVDPGHPERIYVGTEDDDAVEFRFDAIEMRSGDARDVGPATLERLPAAEESVHGVAHERKTVRHRLFRGGPAIHLD